MKRLYDLDILRLSTGELGVYAVKQGETQGCLHSPINGSDADPCPLLGQPCHQTRLTVVDFQKIKFLGTSGRLMG